MYIKVNSRFEAFGSSTLLSGFSSTVKILPIKSCWEQSPNGRITSFSGLTSLINHMVPILSQGYDFYALFLSLCFYISLSLSLSLSIYIYIYIYYKHFFSQITK